MSFDVSKEIVIPISSPDGLKKAAVRFPTDVQFAEWRRKKKIVQKDLGRRSFQIESSKPEQIDLDVFKSILVKDPDGSYASGYILPEDVEEAQAEASYVLSWLSDAEVPERPERQGREFSINMKVLRQIPTTHVLRVPSMREMMDYDRTRSSIIFGQYGTQEIRINYPAAATLYDRLVQKEKLVGYDGAVPVPHKAEAVNILLQEIRAEQEPEQDLGE